MEKYNKILIIRTGAIGDVVHTTGLFQAIKKAYPYVQIHYLTSPLIMPLIKEDKSIEKVIAVNPEFHLFSSSAKEYADKLKNENYDLAINLQPSFKLKMLIKLSGIKKQILYKKDINIHAVENFFKTGLEVFPEIKEPKELRLFLPPESVNQAKERLKGYSKPIIVINAGGMFSKRQGRAYPIHKWIEAGNKLQEKYNAVIILTGAKEDKEFLLPLNGIKNSVNLIGELSLADSCGVISQADFMISGDSGPLHIAAALGVKSVGLYGSSPIKRTGCYSNGINILSKKDCVPCNKRKCKYLKGKTKIYAPCMEQIPPDEILNAVSSIYQA